MPKSEEILFLEKYVEDVFGPRNFRLALTEVPVRNSLGISIFTSFCGS